MTLLVAVVPLLFLSRGAQVAAAPVPAQQWVASWTASPTDSLTPFDAAGRPVPEVLDDQTLRMVVVPHLGATVLRIHLSNRFGKAPAKFGDVTVGTESVEGTPAVSDVTPVTFDGARSVTVAAGDDVVSDPVDLAFWAFEPLAVSIYVPGLQEFPTKNWNANQTSLYAPPLSGDRSAIENNDEFPLQTQAWLYVDGVDVEAPTSTTAIVAFGDSITDGFMASDPFSLPVSQAVANKNGRYPDDLQHRLTAGGIPLSVVNEGISSNRMVTDGEPLLLGPSGVQRFRQDVVDVPGVSGVLVLEGINDLGIPPATTTPAQLIAGYQQVIAMAHTAGIKVWLGTIMPASNAVIDGTLLAPKSEQYREQVNAWIRSQHLTDGVVDFDAAMRDPSDPVILNPAYAGPDNLHPNLLGYQVMSNAVSLAMLETAVPAH